AIAAVALLYGTAAAAAPKSEAEREREREAQAIPMAEARPGVVLPGRTMSLSGSAQVNFADLARAEAAQRASCGSAPERRVLILDELAESAAEVPPVMAPPFAPMLPARAPVLNIASPAPTNSFIGLDDIPMADSSYIIIPPDVGGGVGP